MGLSHRAQLWVHFPPERHDAQLTCRAPPGLCPQLPRICEEKDRKPDGDRASVRQGAIIADARTASRRAHLHARNKWRTRGAGSGFSSESPNARLHSRAALAACLARSPRTRALRSPRTRGARAALGPHGSSARSTTTSCGPTPATPPCTACAMGQRQKRGQDAPVLAGKEFARASIQPNVVLSWFLVRETNHVHL